MAILGFSNLDQRAFGGGRRIGRKWFERKYPPKGVVILRGKLGETARTEERHDLQILRNRRTSMLFLRCLPINGKRSLGSWDQSTGSDIENSLFRIEEQRNRIHNDKSPFRSLPILTTLLPLMVGPTMQPHSISPSAVSHRILTPLHPFKLWLGLPSILLLGP